MAILVSVLCAGAFFLLAVHITIRCVHFIFCLRTETEWVTNNKRKQNKPKFMEKWKRYSLTRELFLPSFATFEAIGNRNREIINERYRLCMNLGKSIVRFLLVASGRKVSGDFCTINNARFQIYLYIPISLFSQLMMEIIIEPYRTTCLLFQNAFEVELDFSVAICRKTQLLHSPSFVTCKYIPRIITHMSTVSLKRMSSCKMFISRYATVHHNREWFVCITTMQYACAQQLHPHYIIIPTSN